jgi:hypothetical protein
MDVGESLFRKSTSTSICLSFACSHLDMSRSAGPSNSQPASQDPPPHTQNGEEEDELESQPRRKKARRVSEEGEARDGSAATRVKEEERTNGKGKRKARMDEMDEDEDKDAAGAEQDGQNDGHERGEDEVGDGNGLNLELSAEQQRKLASRHEDGSVQYTSTLVHVSSLEHTRLDLARRRACLLPLQLPSRRYRPYSDETVPHLRLHRVLPWPSSQHDRRPSAFLFSFLCRSWPSVDERFARARDPTELVNPPSSTPSVSVLAGLQR